MKRRGTRSIKNAKSLSKIADSRWAKRAKKWIAGGFLGPARSRKLLAEMMEAQGQ